jgi:hypothetical protein
MQLYDGALGGLFNLTALLGLPFYLGLVLALNLRARPTLLGFRGRGGVVALGCCKGVRG